VGEPADLGLTAPAPSPEDPGGAPPQGVVLRGRVVV
jgi:hypothetical protein